MRQRQQHTPVSPIFSYSSSAPHNDEIVLKAPLHRSRLSYPACRDGAQFLTEFRHYYVRFAVIAFRDREFACADRINHPREKTLRVSSTFEMF
jgi:hypothetical protein